MKKNGTHLVRFHFFPFKAQSFNLKSAKFSVLVNGISILSEFKPSNDVILKDFILKIESNLLEILFRPFKLGFGFVNAEDFVIDYGTRLVGPSGVEEYKNHSSQVLETIHRINVGLLEEAAKHAVSTDIPNYQKGGATREIAPENVYMTAQQMNRENSSLASRFNITWNFPVARDGILHLIRTYIPSLASPVYVDFVVHSDESGVIQISVGPSDLSSSIRINAILNGAEIMKMVNDVDNTKTVHRRRRQLWELLCSIVGGIVVLFIAVTVFLLPTKCRKREPKESAAESVGWTPLRMLGGSSLSRTSEHGSYGYLGMKIPFADVQSATNNFDRNLIIGYGGFGMVYKGVLRDNVKVAVKRGMPGSRQGLPEFHTEISVLSKIRHRHLVSLVGFCEENSEMILYLSMSM
ncbi:unnamed protein product [Trifolium pratense]|uniref:Uncharacterized protein n=1 Tax=Trifolium pratense TaxID=57577 RepID=A0ACB0KQS9_TRIPR|nr:unnamed protein product [Trifolium pratense]